MKYYSKPEYMWCKPLHATPDGRSVVDSKGRVGRSLRTRKGSHAGWFADDNYVEVTPVRWLAALTAMARKLHSNGLNLRQTALWFWRTMTA